MLCRIKSPTTPGFRLDPDELGHRLAAPSDQHLGLDRHQRFRLRPTPPEVADGNRLHVFRL
jgi:hypothetical protein